MASTLTNYLKMASVVSVYPIIMFNLYHALLSLFSSKLFFIFIIWFFFPSFLVLLPDGFYRSNCRIKSSEMLVFIGGFVNQGAWDKF